MSRHAVPRAASGRARRAAGRLLGVAAAFVSCALAALVAPTPVHAAVTARAPDSDLTIAMTQVGTFATGSNATWTLTVSNASNKKTNGPIIVYDTLPAGFTYSSATGTNWTCSAAGQIVTCNWTGGQISNAQVLNAITLVAAVTTASATSVTNRATVDDTSGDLNRANDHAALTSAVTVRTVATTPDGATVTQLPTKVSPPSPPYSQTFVVTNTGNIADSYSLSAAAAPAGIVTIVSVNGTAGSTSTSASISAGATANVVVVYSVTSGAATGAIATITLTATSTATASSTNPGTLAVTVARAGLTMAKALYRDDQTTPVGAGAVSSNEFVQYRVTVTSTGTAAASSVSVADVIPAEVTYVTATGDAAGWGFATAGSTLTATLAGTLASGASRFFWIRVQVK